MSARKAMYSVTTYKHISFHLGCMGLKDSIYGGEMGEWVDIAFLLDYGNGSHIEIMEMDNRN